MGMNIMPSESEMKKVKETMVEHVGRDSVECGTMGLFKTAKDEKPTECAYVRVNSLVEFIKTISETDPSGYTFEGGFNGKWWVLFSGDKGETT